MLAAAMIVATLASALAAVALVLAVAVDRRLSAASRRVDRLEDMIARRRRLSATLFAGPERRVRFHGRDGLDLFLAELFDDAQRVYLEYPVGDGDAPSVSAALDQMGWAGIAVEADQQRALACQQRRERVFVANTDPLRAGNPKLDELVQDAVSRGEHLKKDARVDVAVFEVSGEQQAALMDSLGLKTHRPRVVIVSRARGAVLGKTRDRMAARGYDRVAGVGPNDVFVEQGETSLAERAMLLADGAVE